MTQIFGGNNRPGARINWCTAKEFDGYGKEITIISFTRLCGDQTNAKPEYRDNKRADGCTYRMVFIDHDKDDQERAYENCYDSFKNTLKDQGIQYGVRYRLSRGKNDRGYNQWHFQEVQGAPVAAPAEVSVPEKAPDQGPFALTPEEKAADEKQEEEMNREVGF